MKSQIFQVLGSSSIKHLQRKKWFKPQQQKFRIMMYDSKRQSRKMAIWLSSWLINTRSYFGVVSTWYATVPPHSQHARQDGFGLACQREVDLIVNFTKMIILHQRWLMSLISAPMKHLLLFLNFSQSKYCVTINNLSHVDNVGKQQLNCSFLSVFRRLLI